MISRILERWDNENNELILRWRIWVMRWFPYRTANFYGFDEETLEPKIGPWKWNRPTRFQK